MATSDILKQAVFDQRIVQLPARYAVEKGALSLTSAPYNAIAASTSQHTYNINVPSQNVFVDRAVDWGSAVFMKLTAKNTATSGPIVAPGVDFALAPFPLHELTQTMTSTINDTSVICNTDSVLHEVLRLTDYKKNRLARHCPSYLDTYANYNAGLGANNSPLAGYLTQSESAEAPNGAWHDLQFTNADGEVLTGEATYTFADSNGVTKTITCQDGVPQVLATSGPAGNFYVVYIRFYSQEKLVLSPFIFADASEWETGLFGVNNIQLVMNMKSGDSIKRVIRYAHDVNENTGTGFQGFGTSSQGSGIEYNTTARSGVFQEAKVLVQYLTPSLDLPLPAKSVVPYMEFPRYITAASAPSTNTSFSIASQTIVLPQIPDMLLIYVKPRDPQSGSNADWYFPITKININFDNFAGLLSSHTPQQLFQMAVHNGLQMDYNQWIGKAWSGVSPGSANGIDLSGVRQIQTTGGFLVLKPGVDFGLQSGQAPSLIGNFTLQFTVECQNWFPAKNGAVVPQLYVVAVNSGFFETLAGSSRIIKGVLSEADIISAEPVLEMSRDGLKRMVGTGFFSNLGSMLSKAVDIYTKTKPLVSGIKGALPEGKVKDILGKVGYGAHGMGVAGAGVAGAGKKSLSARLM